MPREPLERPPEVGRNFVRDMKAFFACGHDTIKADGIAANTLHSLKQHYRASRSCFMVCTSVLSDETGRLISILREC